jgi:beta-N-acetylhexosaminidase
MKKKKGGSRRFFFLLLTIVLILGIINIMQVKGLFIPQQPILNIKGDTIKLSSMTTEQKVAQMVVVAGLRENRIPWRNLQVGGVHLYALQTEHIYNNTIIDLQFDQPIPFFITADFEGCVTPFAHIRNSTSNAEIDNIGASFEKGFREGEFLSKLGFTLNFAPVVDLEDSIWKCRSFPGSPEKVGELAEAYILGLQTQGVIATAKHYPGKTLVVKDPHKFIVAATINEEDVRPYDYLAAKGDVKAIMVSHVISTGEVDSRGVPAVVSRRLINNLKKDFDGLVISDEIHMLGLKNFFDSVDEMYIAVFAAGNDVVLNFDQNPNEVHRMIEIVAQAVDDGKISEKQIDASVTKILEMKGLKVK